MISDDDICVTTMLMMMIMQMMKMENEDGDDDDNEVNDEDDDDGDDDDDATFAILCYSDRARLLACQSVSCPRAPQGAMRCSTCKKSNSATRCSTFIATRRRYTISVDGCKYGKTSLPSRVGSIFGDLLG